MIMGLNYFVLFYFCLTLIGMLSCWFHCGLAFFSRIFVQTWERKGKNPKLASELHVVVVIKEFLRYYTHCFACEVDLHQRVHQVLSVAVKPEDLPHSVHESIIHCRQQKSKKSTNVCLLRRLKPLNKKQPVSGFTLWQVFSSVDLQGEPCSSQGHSSRPQQVSLDIFFILHTLTLVSLRTKTDQHSVQHHIANMQQHHWYKRP